MRVTVVGSGYVGLVTGACLADTGNHVVGLDIDAAKVARLQEGHCPIYEPGLPALLRENLDAGRLRFTTDAADAVTHGEVIFIAVGTPPTDGGAADLTMVLEAARSIAKHANGPKVVAIKSTVPVGTGAIVEREIAENTPHLIPVVSNPEFLKEGSAVDDFFRPDRVVIGAEEAAAGELIRELHLPFVRNRRPILLMSRAASELTKYAANCYLAMRISFINEIAQLCDAVGVDVNEVRAGIGADQRIGYHFMYPGVGYGGSCFPKDIQAMAHIAEREKIRNDLFSVVHRMNEDQRRHLVDKLFGRLGTNLSGKTVAVWGVAFKPKTDDIREAPAVTIIERLLKAGAAVVASDPQALDHLRGQFGDRVRYEQDEYTALQGADALVICTEWNAYRSPDFDELKSRMKQAVIFDGRNLYEPEVVRRRGVEYHSIGRPPVAPGKS